MEAEQLEHYRAALAAAKTTPDTTLSPEARAAVEGTTKTKTKTPLGAIVAPEQLERYREAMGRPSTPRQDSGHDYGLASGWLSYEERRRRADESCERIKTGTFEPGSYLAELQAKLLAGGEA